LSQGASHKAFATAHKTTIAVNSGLPTTSQVTMFMPQELRSNTRA
jgi:hypothetical protein